MDSPVYHSPQHTLHNLMLGLLYIFVSLILLHLCLKLQLIQDRKRWKLKCILVWVVKPLSCMTYLKYLLVCETVVLTQMIFVYLCEPWWFEKWPGRFSTLWDHHSIILAFEVTGQVAWSSPFNDKKPASVGLWK